MLSGCSQLFWSHSQLIWSRAARYSQRMWAENADVIGSCDLCLWAATGTGQIDADIYPKERMAMAQMADFPIILRVRCTVVEEQLAERFRV